MVRLFSAIELPGSVRAELAERLHTIREAGSELRWVPPERWHITLGFYGDREHGDRRGSWFRRQAGGLASARLRLRGAGRAPAVRGGGRSPGEGRHGPALPALPGSRTPDANASRYDFTAHVTLARWR